MNKKTMVLLSIFVVTLSMMIMVSTVSAWPNNSIYVQDVGSRTINIDGQLGDGEWTSEEEKYTERLGGLSVFNATEISFDLVMLRNTDDLFVRLTYTLNNYDGYTGNASLGFALSDNGDIGGMQDTEDRRAFYHNSSDSSSSVIAYDLHNCAITTPITCTEPGGLQPGTLDNIQNGEGAFSYDSSTGRSIFELRIPLAGDGSVEDVDIKDGVKFKFVINPYYDIIQTQYGHAGVGTQQLEITFEPRPFFPRPEGPMDSLSIMFNLIFAIIIIGISLLFYFSARNDKLAEKLYRVEITEDMANQSLLMEIGYYNSSFVSLFTLLYFWAYSVIAFFYGIWANWGLIGFAINVPSLVISSFAGYDLIKRNHNPHDIPEDQQRKLGKEIESTGSLWIFPPAFLGLTLFMLVFIGIDVVT